MHGRLAAAIAAPALEGEADVSNALDRRLLLESPAPIAVALSGGGDSLALLRLAAAWAARERRPLLALTVDHGLSPDGPAWTRFAAARAAESEAAFRALAWEGAKPMTGLPAAARAARHALLARAAREAGASVVLLGHTADDIAETDHMRASDTPGIGHLREWSPSPAWPEGRGVMLLRPMLRLRRSDLRAWLAARGEAWIEDPANEDPRFARSRARARTGAGEALVEPSPAAPGVEAAVAGLATLFEDAGEGGLRAPTAALVAAPESAALHVLSAAVLCVGGGARPPRGAETARLLARLRDGGPASTLAGTRIALRHGVAAFSREPGDRARNPRTDVDGVIDGRFLPTEDGPAYLTLDRFRAACFLIEREMPAGACAASGRLPPRGAVA